MRCVRDGSENPLCFFFKNIKIAANSPTRSCEKERRSNLQGHAQKNSYPKKKRTLNPLIFSLTLLGKLHTVNGPAIYSVQPEFHCSCCTSTVTLAVVGSVYLPHHFFLQFSIPKSSSFHFGFY